MNALLAESDSVREFVNMCVKVSTTDQEITVEQLVTDHQSFCTKWDWYPAARAAVERQLPDLISTIHGVYKRNDIKSEVVASRGRINDATVFTGQRDQ